MSNIGLGIIGCGGRLCGLVQRLLAHNGGITVQALCDPQPQAISRFRAETDSHDAEVYENHQALLEISQVDWVWIGSYNCFHAEQAVAAMEAGKDVFCEKPLATTLEDCLTMREVHRRTGRKFAIGFTLRYAPMYPFIYKMLQSGRIGRLISMEFNETIDFNHGGYIHQDWRRWRQYAGTHMLEKCCHDVDLVNWMVGSRVRRVASFAGLDFFLPKNEWQSKRIGPNKQGVSAFQRYGSESPFRNDKDIIDNQVAILEYENHVRVCFHANCNSAIPERRMYLLGEEGGIRADLMRGIVEYVPLGWDEKVETFNFADGCHGGGDEVLVQEINDFMVHGNPPRAGLEEGLESALTCFAIDQAVDTGEVIDLSEMWEKVDQEASVSVV